MKRSLVHASVLLVRLLATAPARATEGDSLHFIRPLLPVASEQIAETRVRTWRVPVIVVYRDGHTEEAVAEVRYRITKEGAEEGLCLAGVAMVVGAACTTIGYVCYGGGAVAMPAGCLAGGFACLLGTGFVAFAGPAGICKPAPDLGRGSFYLEPPAFSPAVLGPIEAWPAGPPLPDLFSAQRLLGPDSHGVPVRETEPSVAVREPGPGPCPDPGPETAPVTTPCPEPEPTTELCEALLHGDVGPVETGASFDCCLGE